MKRFLTALALGALLQVSAFAQTSLFFDINYGGDPPPHTPGLTNGGALLTTESCFVAVYLDNTLPTSGSVVEQAKDGSWVTVFALPNLVFAAYPPPINATAYSYEQMMHLSAAQIEELLAGKWFVRIAYGDVVYLGQLAPRGPLALLDGSILTEQQQRPLRATLAAVNAALARGNSATAIKLLQTFEDKVANQILPYDADLAAELIAAAEEFIALLGG